MLEDEKYMKIALELALKGLGAVNPNPLVGAVIVKDGEIVAKGYHEKYGELHAERNAIKNATKSIEGATIYVTLEPCCHYGKTPPCTEAIIESGIKKVVVGSLDPNVLMAGRGVQILQENNIEVVVGVLESECKEINKIFFHYIQNKTPYVLMKYAMTLDGKIATVTGKSKWITNEKAREYSHSIRNVYTAIMVGVGTVLEDDPLLTTRVLNENIKNYKNPIRIICDTNLRTPISSKIVQTANEVRTIIATSLNNEEKIADYKNKNCEVIVVGKDINNHLSLSELMVELGEINIDCIILEGGSQLNFSALKSQIVQEIHTYIAPKMFGGISAKTPVGGDGFIDVDNDVHIIQKSIQNFDDNILIKSEVKYKCLQE